MAFDLGKLNADAEASCHSRRLDPAAEQAVAPPSVDSVPHDELRNESRGTTAPAVAAPATDVIVLPDASSAEGIAVDRGATFDARQLFVGDIYWGDLQRGSVERLVDAPAGQMAVASRSTTPVGCC